MPKILRPKEKEYDKRYYQKHKTKLLNQQKEYYLKNKEKILNQRKEYSKQYCQENKEKIGMWHKRNREQYRLNVLTHYSSNPPHCQCKGCYYSDHDCPIEFLTIDHINNDGAKQRKEMKFTGGLPFYRWLIKNNYPKGFQVLCWNCNCAKGKYGVCPHEKTE